MFNNIAIDSLNVIEFETSTFALADMLLDMRIHVRNNPFDDELDNP